MALDDGLTFAGYPQPPTVPPDPTGDDWRGEPGPPGPQGEPGPPGADGLPGEPEGAFISTGSSEPRTLADRFADVANVLDFGADPTGVDDSTAAFRAAVATSRRVYIPHGIYTVTDVITITGGQLIYGDGPRSSMIRLLIASFNMSAAGVFVLASGTREADVEIRDLWLRFEQPNFPGMTRANIVQYPPGINTASGNRAKFINLQISGAWVGILYDGGGAGFLDRVEISAYSIGLSFAATTPVLDGTHISNYHWWNFDMSLNQAAVMWDGVAIAADLGRIDGLVASDWVLFRGNVNIKATAGVPGFYYMTNILMDSISSTLTVSNAFVFEAVNWHFTKSASFESPGILITGGRTSFTNLAIQASMATTAAIQVTGGSVAFNGGTLWWKETAGAEFVSITGGACYLRNINFSSHTAAHTAPYVHQSGAGALIINNCTFPASGSGVAIQMDTVVSGSWVGASNYYGAMTTTGSGFVASVTSPVIMGRSNPTTTSAQLVASSVNGTVGQEAKQRFFGTFPTTDGTPHMIASLRSGFSSFAWTAGYLDVYLTNATNTTSDDANTIQVARYTMSGLGVTGTLSSTGVLSSTAGVVTSGVAAAGGSAFRLQSAAGTDHSVHSYSGNLPRWGLFLGTGVESGSNVGADVALVSYDDAGTVFDTPLTVTRSTGYVFAQNLRVSAFGLNISTPQVRQTVTGARGGSPGLASALTALATFGLITDSTTSAAYAGTFTTLAASSTVSGAGFAALLSPYAPLASPTLTGTPAAPTATAGTNTSQIATTAFVTAAVTAGTAGVASFNTRTGAVTLATGDLTALSAYAGSFTTLAASGTVSGAGFTALLAPYAPLASPTLTGTPAAPTASPGTNTTQLATTAFVIDAVSGTAGVASFNTRTGTVTLTTGDVTGLGAYAGGFTTLDASGAVSGAGFTALFASPPAIGGTAAAAGAFTTISASGQVTSTVSTGTAPLVVASTTNVANLNASSLGGATFAAPGAIGGGTPAAGAFTTLSASSTVSGSGFTTLLAPYAPLASPTFTGTVTIPSGASISGFAPLASPTFTGTPAAPTASPGTNTTQVATTAFSLANRRNSSKLQAQWVNGAVVTNDTVWMSYDAPYAGTINTLKHVTTSGSFTVAIKINGTNVTSLSAVSVTSTPGTATATAANTFSAGDVITAVISAASGSPTGAMLSVDLTWS